MQLVPPTASLLAALLASATGQASTRVTVTFTGTPPQARQLDAKSDPYCAKEKLVDESVRVAGGKLENVVVRVIAGAQEQPGSGEVVIDQRGCLYSPRVSAAAVGQTLVIKNADPTLHNVHSYVGSGTGFNRAQPPRAPPIKRLLEAGDAGRVIALRCDVHPWMSAFVVVGDTPYVAVTDARGEARLELPPGSYTLETWHERYGTKQVKVIVAPDGTAEATVSYSGTEPPPN